MSGCCSIAGATLVPSIISLVLSLWYMSFITNRCVNCAPLFSLPEDIYNFTDALLGIVTGVVGILASSMALNWCPMAVAKCMNLTACVFAACSAVATIILLVMLWTNNPRGDGMGIQHVVITPVYLVSIGIDVGLACLFYMSYTRLAKQHCTAEGPTETSKLTAPLAAP